MRGIWPSGDFLQTLPLRIHFPGKKRLHEVITNINYPAKTLSEVCKWKYARRQELFQRILRRATVGSHCWFSIVSFISLCICRSAYSNTACWTVCMLGERRKFKMNFESRKSHQVWIICEIVWIHMSWSRSKFMVHMLAWSRWIHGVIMGISQRDHFT